MITKSPMEVEIGKNYWKAYDISRDGFSIRRFRILCPSEDKQDHYLCDDLAHCEEGYWTLTEPFFETSDEAIDYAKQVMEDLNE